MRSAVPVYLVSSGSVVEQAFAELKDAEAFALQTPDARISRHRVRTSIDEAVVIFDRRVVVAHGATVVDRTEVVRQFIDDPTDTPGPAVVEWFHDGDTSWHITGFGVDRAALNAKVQSVIERVGRLGQGTTAGAVDEGSPS